MTVPMVLDGAMNGPAFLAYIEQVLAPTLAPGDIVIMDNLPAHKPAGVRKAIEAAGASPALSLALQPRLQSHRAGLRQAEGLAPQAPPPAPSPASGKPSRTRSRASRPVNARTTSSTPDMNRCKVKMLLGWRSAPSSPAVVTPRQAIVACTPESTHTAPATLRPGNHLETTSLSRRARSDAATASLNPVPTAPA